VDIALAMDGEGPRKNYKIRPTENCCQSIFTPIGVKNMHASPRNHETTQRARALRKGNNAAEGALWNVLKARGLDGQKFVRQHPIGPYFADFVHRGQRLVVEVDGSQHVENTYDQRRDAFLLQQGYSVLRFWSRDVLQHRAEVCDAILAALGGQLFPVNTLDISYHQTRVPSPSRAVARSTSPASGRGV
jgi:very-short-patch-repair endonuclease